MKNKILLFCFRDIENCEVIKLVKDFSGLGFSLDDSSSGVRVRSLTPNGPASRDGRLQTDDRILSVNDQNVQKASYREVTDILKMARGTIKLIVQHPSAKNRRSSRGSTDSRDKEIIIGQETEIEIVKGNKCKLHEFNPPHPKIKGPFLMILC